MQEFTGEKRLSYLATLPPVWGSALGSSTVAAATAPSRATSALILPNRMCYALMRYTLNLILLQAVRFTLIFAYYMLSLYTGCQLYSRCTYRSLTGLASSETDINAKAFADNIDIPSTVPNKDIT